MKNIYKIFLIGLVLIGTMVSCEESDLEIDKLYENADTSGAFIRTLEFPQDVVNLADSIDILIEVQEGDGSQPPTFTEVRVYVAPYDDQDLLFPTVDDQGNPLGETFMMSLQASEFSPSEINGLPSAQINMPAQLIADTYPTAVFTIPTFIATRLELELADGRIFTNTNVGASVATGDFFATPFLYKTIFLNF